MYTCLKTEAKMNLYLEMIYDKFVALMKSKEPTDNGMNVNDWSMAKSQIGVSVAKTKTDNILRNCKLGLHEYCKDHCNRHIEITEEANEEEEDSCSIGDISKESSSLEMESNLTNLDTRMLNEIQAIKIKYKDRLLKEALSKKEPEINFEDVSFDYIDMKKEKIQKYTAFKYIG